MRIFLCVALVATFMAAAATSARASAAVKGSELTRMTNAAIKNGHGGLNRDGGRVVLGWPSYPQRATVTARRSQLNPNHAVLRAEFRGVARKMSVFLLRRSGGTWRATAGFSDYATAAAVCKRDRYMPTLVAIELGVWTQFDSVRLRSCRISRRVSGFTRPMSKGQITQVRALVDYGPYECTADGTCGLRRPVTAPPRSRDARIGRCDWDNLTGKYPVVGRISRTNRSYRVVRVNCPVAHDGFAYLESPTDILMRGNHAVAATGTVRLGINCDALPAKIISPRVRAELGFCTPF